MPQFIEGSLVLQVIWAVGILFVAALLGWIVLLVMRRVARRFAKREKMVVVSQFIECLTRPVFILILVQGLLFSFRSLPVLEQWHAIFAQVSMSAIIVIGTYGIARVLNVGLEWYLSSRAVKKEVTIDEGLVRFLKRIMLAIVYTLGALILMDYLNVEISPILAGLGIGGLAIALALQPLLSNFFAGTQIIADRVARVGDFLQLENEELSGYVIDLGWRSTRIRTLFDTIVIIPNSQLADSTVTNFQAPDEELTFVVKSGVTYDSDLSYVKNVALQVAQEVIKESDDAVKTFEPWFIYDECGDANINFWVWIRAKDYMSSLRLKSEFIIHLRARFQQEEIETTMITG